MGKIMLVEDNTAAAKRVIEYIKKIDSELEIVTFAEAGTAYAYAEKERISLFILDIQLQEIAFLEAFGKKVVIHTNSDRLGIKQDTISDYSLPGLLSLIEHDSFVQCHKRGSNSDEKIDTITFIAGFRVGIGRMRRRR